MTVPRRNLNPTRDQQLNAQASGYRRIVAMLIGGRQDTDPAGFIASVKRIVHEQGERGA